MKYSGKFSGLMLGLVALMASACQGGKQFESHSLLAASGPGFSAGQLPGGTIGSNNGGGGVIPGPPGTTGGNPTLTSMNPAADPSMLSLCMVGNPVLLQGKMEVPITISTKASIARPFDLATGNSPLALFYYPNGTYSGLRITYSTACAVTYSARMKNTHGEFETARTVTIQFDGVFALNGKSTMVFLDIENILRKLALVTEADQLPLAFESINGTVRQ